ncbi:MAG: TfoX/Sxy family DNA transformation protein [Devosia sp.]
MSDVETMPNIGKVLAGRLRDAGIATDTELKKLGDAEAFLRLRATLPEDSCVHTRLALAGAVRGIRWHALDEDLRKKLTAEAK